MQSIERDASQAEPPRPKRFNSTAAMALVAVALLAIPALLVLLTFGMVFFGRSETTSISGDSKSAVVQVPDENGNWCVGSTSTEITGSLCVIDAGAELRVEATGLAADAEVTITGASGNTMSSPVDTPQGDFNAVLSGLIITLPVHVTTTWADGTAVSLTALPG